MQEYTNILLPGRHHVLTNFQHDYFANLLAHRDDIVDIDSAPLMLGNNVSIIWAITSANHSGTRRNPLPGDRREAAIERFMTDIPAKGLVYLMNDLGPTERFASYVLKEIDAQSRGRTNISPQNTVVACSTPSVIAMYETLGYRILPVELTDRIKESFSALRPWDCTLAIAAAGEAWADSAIYKENVHRSSQAILERYGLGDRIVEIHADPLLGDEGDITQTRDYNTYGRSFDDGAERKIALFKEFIRPGRIVDVGSATGSILEGLSHDKDFWESDLLGIEVTRKLYEIAERRRADGVFGNENVFFYHRNALSGPLFPAGSIDTTLTVALTHELISYLGHDALVTFLERVYTHTVRGGMYINLDVTGPENPDALVRMYVTTTDGATSGAIGDLSTAARFRRFAEDFRKEEGEAPLDHARLGEEDGWEVVELSAADAAEFMSKKDYTDNWESEMHERFCTLNLSMWRELLTRVGFRVHDASHDFRNEWIVENRWKNSVKLVDPRLGDALPYPVTNILLIAQKP